MYSKAILAIAAIVATVSAKPIEKRQGVTALIAPPGAVPSGCDLTYSGLFAIAAIKVDYPIPATFAKRFYSPNKRQVVTQLPDAQPGAGTSTLNVITQISDAQPQAPTATTVPVITQISDAQPQAPTATVAVITQISDAQPQAPATVPVITQISDAQPQAPASSTMWHTAASQIHDGQVQVIYTVSVISQISDAQPQAPVTTAVVSQLSEGQPQAPTTASVAGSFTTGSFTTGSFTLTGSFAAASVTSSTPVSPAPPSVSMVACKTNSTLELDLNNGRLLDGLGRIGYIAGNFQFQFDAGVPQAGALYTTGFSVCSNNTLALGPTTIFWQCLSGSFYNLYDEYWAPQCTPVNLRVVGLVNC